jgi:hypothetical protein
MGEKEWSAGLSSGAYKNKGTKKKVKHRSGKTPRVGIHARRMAKRR